MRGGGGGGACRKIWEFTFSADLMIPKCCHVFALDGLSITVFAAVLTKTATSTFPCSQPLQSHQCCIFLQYSIGFPELAGIRNIRSFALAAHRVLEAFQDPQMRNLLSSLLSRAAEEATLHNLSL